MVKRLEKLTETQKGILEILPKSKNSAIKIDEIKIYLKKAEGIDAEDTEIRQELKGLIKYGSVRANLEEDKGEVKYFLSRGIGSGYRNQRTLHGKFNPFRDIYKSYKRLFGTIFLVLGVGLVIYNGASVSGAVISLGKIGLKIMPIAIISFVIGLVLFLTSYKKKK